jgi:rubrerythrin
MFFLSLEVESNMRPPAKGLNLTPSARNPCGRNLKRKEAAGMAIFKCEKCGATKEGRCRPRKCPECGAEGTMKKEE